MSLTKTQIDSLIDRNCRTNSTSYPIADKTEDENVAMDEVFSIISQVGGKWQYDDSNHGDYPTITFNIADGQRSYSFTEDEQGNLILDIYKVFAYTSATSDVYEELFPVDSESDIGMEGFNDGRNVAGAPWRYNKRANGITLDGTPDFNRDNGIKMIISREGSYFTTSDTTKKPGFAGTYHEYIVLHCSAAKCTRMEKFALADRYEQKKIAMAEAIRKHYRDRSKDETPRLTAEPINSI